MVGVVEQLITTGQVRAFRFGGEIRVELASVEAYRLAHPPGTCRRDAPPDALTIHEAAEALGRQPHHVRKWIESGRLPAVRSGLPTGRIVYDFSVKVQREAVEEFRASEEFKRGERKRTRLRGLEDEADEAVLQFRNRHK